MGLPLHEGFSRNCEGAFLGQALRTAANWDDDCGEGGKVSLPDGEPIRFSQRGLNSVLIALWCCSGSKSVWDWLGRVIYIGGDTDTIAAVCGQIACPLLPIGEVTHAFRHFVALGDCTNRRPCANVAAAAAQRYFGRALLFCGGHWGRLSTEPRLVDPCYPNLTDATGRLALGSRQALQVLWVDSAFGSKRHDRNESLRLRYAEGAESRGELSIVRCSENEEALNILQLARTGELSLDAVVTDLHHGGKTDAGLELLQVLDSLWGKVSSRPVFYLLTPYRDKQVIATVRRHPPSYVVRHDRPEELRQKLAEGRCQAAELPKAAAASLAAVQPNLTK